MTRTMELESVVAADPALRFEPLTGSLGAIVHGVRLSGDLSPAVVAGLTEALHRHRVLFFRDQHHLDDEGQEAFAALMGEPEPHPIAPLKSETRATWAVDSADGIRANSWHTDVTFIPDIPYASILRAAVLPEIGGDTMWADTCAAYRSLPANLKAFADASRGIHTNVFDSGLRPTDTKIGKTGYRAIPHFCDHPVVHVVPETGERALLLGHFFRYFVGMPLGYSEPIFALLQSHITRPEHTVRWRWAGGDVAMWDNRSTQHYGVNDYVERRVLNRVSLRGTATVGIDGRQGFACTVE